MSTYVKHQIFEARQGRIIILALTFQFIISCTESISKQSIAGHYETDRITTYERIKYRITDDVTGRIIKSEIKLRDNRSFEFTTCAVQLKGIWTLEDDYITLKVEKSRFKNDSIANLRSPDFTHREDFLRFRIEEDRLIGIVENSNGTYSINKLAKL